MRKSIFVTFLFLAFVTTQIRSQNIKIGYVNVEKVFSQWPEVKQANTSLQEYEQKLASRLQAKVQDFQTKLADYQEKISAMNATTRQDTETELQNLQTQIQQFEVNAQQSIAEKNSSLLQPLQIKLQNTIDVVGKENGYTHIFSLNSALLYTSDTNSDISGKIAQKLGFTLTNEGN